MEFPPPGQIGAAPVNAYDGASGVPADTYAELSFPLAAGSAQPEGDEGYMEIKPDDM